MPTDFMSGFRKYRSKVHLQNGPSCANYLGLWSYNDGAGSSNTISLSNSTGEEPCSIVPWF
ncbi:hypothetical protein HCEG_01402 [Histoplasma capsulatum var. duboisii H88]|uniref:Uncharacterized protein n=1 Tax=Ajellomyces capsulatus (strain H88) TaxID=544711 RepID=F0U4Z7_AJEC8|nr:hypothetical protein HCEG_01402 [Histoplasma capsulatum var. duboisii H88]